MTHDEENDRNETWLRQILDGLTASNSSAEAIAQMLYSFAHGGEPIEAIPDEMKNGQEILLRNGNWQIVGHWHRQQGCWANNGPTYERIPADEQPTHYTRLPRMKLVA